MTKILCVCLGNICRSPAAEGVLRAQSLARGLDLTIDSAGTGAWHAGSPPDRRMIAAAKARGIDLRDQIARQVELSDFYMFDYLLAMDASNLADLQDMAPPNKECVIQLFLDHAGGDIRETPDPYYGGAQGFEEVLDLVERGANGFLDHLGAQR